MTDRLPSWSGMTLGGAFGLRPKVIGPEEPPGRALDRGTVRHGKPDAAPGSRADGQIDAFISHRHDRRVEEEGARPEEEAWKESTRRYNATTRAQNALAWAEWHRGQVERLRAVCDRLCAGHQAEIEKLEKKGRDAA